MSPLPKNYNEKTYGKIVGHLQNLGFSLADAKKKTDKAVTDMVRKNKRKKNK